MAPVEQADDRGVDVPDFVGLGGPDADARLRGMNPDAGTAPSSLPNEAIPGGGRGIDRADALREQGEPTGGDVAVIRRLDHLSDLGDFIGGEALR